MDPGPLKVPMQLAQGRTLVGSPSSPEALEILGITDIYLKHGRINRVCNVIENYRFS
jgi:hypothetical protein